MEITVKYIENFVVPKTTRSLCSTIYKNRKYAPQGTVTYMYAYN